MSSKAEAPIPPPQSPFLRALNAPRYERQNEIRQYEETTGRALIVVHGPIAPTIRACKRAAFGFTNFADYRIRALLYASNPT